MNAIYCWECATLQDEDDLGRETELMDPGVPDSWMTRTVCGHCGQDNFIEINAWEFRETLDDLLKWATNVPGAPRWVHGASKFLDQALEYLYE